jgi:glycine cleavage system aminomethyltransferase T
MSSATAAEPNLGYLRRLARPFDAEIVEATEDFASLAVQGPRSREILALLTSDVLDLPYFGFAEPEVADAQVLCSRTGFSGDLGFELFIPASQALGVLDAIIECGTAYGLRPDARKPST